MFNNCNSRGASNIREADCCAVGGDAVVLITVGIKRLGLQTKKDRAIQNYVYWIQNVREDAI
jgi:hypothetical protein